MPTPSLDHIEKTLADAYRKEIDQEENVWRSLPFFAATLALQLAAVVGLADRLPPLVGADAWRVGAPLFLAGAATLGALVGMAAAIFPVGFTYLSPEPKLLDYVRQLEEAERASPPDLEASESGARDDAISALKSGLARQYAAAAFRNRQINQRRALFRSMAGLATLASVLAILVLVGIAVRHHLASQRPGTAFGPTAAGGSESASHRLDANGAQARPSAVLGGPGGPAEAIAGPSSSDAGRDQGLVQQQRGPGPEGQDRARDQ